jgi:hypothetical protein
MQMEKIISTRRGMSVAMNMSMKMQRKKTSEFLFCN